MRENLFGIEWLGNMNPRFVNVIDIDMNQKYISQIGKIFKKNTCFSNLVIKVCINKFRIKITDNN